MEGFAWTGGVLTLTLIGLTTGTEPARTVAVSTSRDKINIIAADDKECAWDA
jgi:hypothetical protein